MADFFAGDPYFPVGGNNGWLEAEPIAPVEENPPQVVEEEIEEEEEDPEEGSDADDDMDEDMIEDFGEETDTESELDDPRYPVRGRDEPLPPPSFQVYRQPNGGPLWMHTPRKRTIPIRRQDIFMTGIPLQGDTPRWAEDLDRWSREHGQRPPYGMSRDYFDLSRGTSADRALPVVVRRISRLDEQARAITSQLLDVGATTQVTAARFQRLDSDHDRTQRLVETLQEDLVTARAENREIRERLAGMEQRMLDAERRADEAVGQARELLTRVATYYGL